MADPNPKPGMLDSLFNSHLVTPTEGEDGLGPTMGEDVSAEHERDEDARHHAHSEDQGPGV